MSNNINIEINKEILEEHIRNRYIFRNKHPEKQLFIYNYTQATQYEAYWNDYTEMCRGLIMNDLGEVVARPFKKFFNLSEHQPSEIPNETFEVYEKMDGSLGILYFDVNLDDNIIDNKGVTQPFMASRGSFNSEQSIKANEMLQQKYPHTFSKLNKNITYLFEIIYPENRIVVDYGKREELVLLAMIDTKTGLELPLVDIGFPLVKKYDGINDLETLKSLENSTQEGFVVKFASGFRVKVKFAEYVRLHRIITRVSNISIWENMKNNANFDEILERVPDEFFAWVKNTRLEILTKYEEIEKNAKQIFENAPIKKPSADYKLTKEDRKLASEQFLKFQHNRILFAMLDGKKYDDYIWKCVRPSYEKPFLNNEE